MAKRIIREDAPILGLLGNLEDDKEEKPVDELLDNLTAKEPKKPALTKKIKKEETKTQRVQLVLKPSTVEKAKAEAWKQHISLNEYINQAIEEKLGGKK